MQKFSVIMGFIRPLIHPANGMPMLNFVRIAALEKNFASDRSKGNDSAIRSSLAGGVSMAIDVAPEPNSCCVFCMGWK